jgi:hypothetical protein
VSCSLLTAHPAALRAMPRLTQPAGNIELIRRLVQQFDCDLRVKSMNSWTPLHYAAAYNQVRPFVWVGLVGVWLGAHVSCRWEVHAKAVGAGGMALTARALTASVSSLLVFWCGMVDIVHTHGSKPAPAAAACSVPVTPCHRWRPSKR